MTIQLPDIRKDIEQQVEAALAEDIGSGDITAQLIPEGQNATATILTRETCILCGAAWLEETFKQLGGLDEISWHANDGDTLKANQTFVTLKGNARTLLTGERTALNFLQLLSGVASLAHDYAKARGNSNTRILDTRKTLPGLRTAQKYAVAVGGCDNHRIGLYDAFLIKENHIAACGSIRAAIQLARKIAADKTIEVETETLSELEEAIAAGADIAMLDNFSDAMLEQAMLLDRTHTQFEYSGNLALHDIQKLSRYDIDCCSFGALTKHVRAVDLSMRISPR